MIQGIYILAIMVYGARHEVTLIPYMEFPNWQLCNAYKASESLELGLPLVCITEGEA